MFDQYGKPARTQRTSDRRSKGRDQDQRAERAAKHQRKARVEQVREQELTMERPTRGNPGPNDWPFMLGGWAGF
jgi:hypothetical protein